MYGDENHSLLPVPVTRPVPAPVLSSVPEPVDRLDAEPVRVTAVEIRRQMHPRPVWLRRMSEAWSSPALRGAIAGAGGAMLVAAVGSRLGVRSARTAARSLASLPEHLPTGIAVGSALMGQAGPGSMAAGNGAGVIAIVQEWRYTQVVIRRY